MLERDIQKASVTFARKRGWYASKFTSPARRSVPDYIFLKNGFVFWIEFKATGKPASEAQKEEHKKLQENGAFVYVCDSIEKGKSALLQMEMFT